MESGAAVGKPSPIYAIESSIMMENRNERELRFLGVASFGYASWH